MKNKIFKKSTLNKSGLLTLAVSVALASTVVNAKLSAADAEKLGKELTPMGAVQAANNDGSIPEWTGGITKTPEGYSVGDHHVDPYPNDKIKYTITEKNVSDYKGLLTPGQVKLFETYPETFKMNVYQTHRSASYPDHVYQAVKINSTRAELVKDGNGIQGAAVGIPFPIPANGLEAIWNHTLRYRGESVTRQGGQAAPTALVDFSYLVLLDFLLLPYIVYCDLTI